MKANVKANMKKPISTEKMEETIENVTSILDAYADTLNVEECFEILGPIQYENAELADFLLGCMICAWMGSDVNIDAIRYQIKSGYHVELATHKIEHLLFTRVYLKVLRYIEARDAAFKGRISTLDMLTDRYGDKASTHLSQFSGNIK